MTRGFIGVIIVMSVALISALSAEVSAAEHRVEAQGSLGYTLPLRDAEGAFPGGPQLGLNLHYLSPSGFGAFVASGWTRLFTESPQAMESWNIEGGLSIAWWRLRVDAGLGASLLHVFASHEGVAITSLEPALTYSLGLTGTFYEGPVDVGAELRAHIVSGSDIAWLTLNVIIGGALFEWTQDE